MGDQIVSVWEVKGGSLLRVIYLLCLFMVNHKGSHKIWDALVYNGYVFVYMIVMETVAHSTPPPLAPPVKVSKICVCAKQWCVPKIIKHSLLWKIEASFVPCVSDISRNTSETIYRFNMAKSINTLHFFNPLEWWFGFISCLDQYSNPLDTISAVNPCCSNLNSVVVDCGLSSSCASSPVARQSSGWAGRPTKFNSRKRWLFSKHTHTLLVNLRHCMRVVVHACVFFLHSHNCHKRFDTHKRSQHMLDDNLLSHSFAVWPQEWDTDVRCGFKIQELWEVGRCRWVLWKFCVFFSCQKNSWIPRVATKKPPRPKRYR